jgi:Ni/Co efflux regulator RcnB
MSGTTHHAHGNGGSGNAGNGSVGNNAMMGGSMSGTTHRAHGNGGTGNAGNNAMMGGGMTGSTHRSSHNNNNTAVVFGSGGHGYKNKSDFGHARHNSAFDALRRAYHATHHYHAGTYRRPPGYYYRTWNYGDFLPALFFDQQYFIDDFDDYGLADPPEGTVWVRYGDDALLVDEDTGEIIRVVYGIFY